MEFVERVERFRKGCAAAAAAAAAGGAEDDDDEKEIEERTREELRRVIEWCTDKFGDGPWVDARSAYAGPGDEVRKIGEDMVTGSKGWREF
ncbi:hypothetical protein BS50DRAFT_572815 [Corynespora cassiicola Philippines]|uniref:Uncharacterized protein n=1 Tax=Corynespora cassiicola Philippines TaxID=1448308 RepID=A0A2T2NQV3_CORCC|nr:hypothetical protein BS50DRAFT_572815 [Corynespora cassiicola Philippines]